MRVIDLRSDTVTLPTVETNIVRVDVSGSGRDAAYWPGALKQRGVT